MSLKSALRRSVAGTGALEHLDARRYTGTTYSQFGEDAYIEGFYRRLAYWAKIEVTSGWIVDVGAFKPIKYSNTYHFYRQGWRTINIDPTPGSMAAFDKVRPRDINLELAVGPDPGEVTFYVFGQPSVWNTMDVEAARQRQAQSGKAPREVPTRVRRLDDLLDEHLKGPFELLSIDAEGYDLEILQSNDFSRFAPRLILIEVHDIDLERLAAHPVVTYLAGFGYRLFAWLNPNLLFVRADSLPGGVTTALGPDLHRG